MLFAGLLLLPGNTQASEADRVRLFSDADEDQTVGPEEEAVFKWLLYTDDDTLKYLVIIKAESNDEAIKTKFETEGDETLILDSSKVITLVLSVWSTNKNEDIDAAITVTITFRQLGGNANETTKADTVYVSLSQETEKSQIEFLGGRVDFPDQLHRFDNQFVLFGIEVVLYTALALLLFFLITPAIRKLAGKSKTKLDDMLVELVRMPALLLLITWGVLQAVQTLDLEPAAMQTFSRGWSAFAIILVTWVALRMFKTLSRYFGKLYAKKTQIRVDHILVPAINKIATVIIVFFGLMYALARFGIDITVFITGMGILGLVIAFAAQDTLSNFFGGLFLIIEPKFKEGDQVLVNDKFYVVSNIGMRTTVLADKSSNQEVIVPNNKLANEMIVNMMEPDDHYRVGVKCYAAYGTDLDKVEKILREVARDNPKTIIDDEHSVYYEFCDMGASSLEFLIKVWIKDLNDRWGVPHEMRSEIYKRFQKEGIEIPFPQMDVHLKDQILRGKKKGRDVDI